MKTEWTRWSQGPGVKVILILGLVGILTLVLALQDDLVSDRQGFRHQAVARTVGEWGGEQRFAGPFLRIPYSEVIAKGRGETEIRESFAYLLPQDFSAQVDLKAETRTRGIYEVPLYRAIVELSGQFILPSGRTWIPEGASVRWDRATLWYFLGGARGLDEAPQVVYGGIKLTSSRVPSGDQPGSLDALAAPVEVPSAGGFKAFRLRLVLKGGSSFGVFPAGQDSRIQVVADRGFPTFGGDYLPSRREVGASGFQADWSIPALARSVASSGTAQTWSSVLESISFASFDLGVAFDGYRLIDRAMKYGLLFIIVPFVGLFLYEVFARIRIHPVQYLFVGLAVLMFYLLVLSLSERMDFVWAFFCGALAVCLLLGAYSAAILKGRWAGAWGLGGMGVLYGLLYFIVQSEDNALLVGSLFLFGLLTAVMVVTRRVDWYQLGTKE